MEDLYYILYSNTSRNSPAGLRPQAMMAWGSEIINAATFELGMAGSSHEEMAGIGFVKDRWGHIRRARELARAEILDLSIQKLGDDGRLYMAFPATHEGAAAFLQAAEDYGLEVEASALVEAVK